VASPRALRKSHGYLSALKIPETLGFGTDRGFLGAREDESK